MFYKLNDKGVEVTEESPNTLLVPIEHIAPDGYRYFIVVNDIEEVWQLKDEEVTKLIWS